MTIYLNMHSCFRSLMRPMIGIVYLEIYDVFRSRKNVNLSWFQYYVTPCFHVYI